MSDAIPNAAGPKPRNRYVPAIGPKLKRLFHVVLAMAALLGANSAYLAAISFIEFLNKQTYQDYFYQVQFIIHLALGLLLIVPFVIFGMIHMVTSWNRKNRRAVKMGYALFAVCLGVLITGLLLMRIAGFFELRQATTRATVYWLHVGLPLVGCWFYWLHRLVGQKIKWRVGAVYGSVLAASVLVMVVLQSQDPRKWNQIGPKDGVKYFQPSLARTATGNFIPADTLLMDSYCLKCHEESYNGWFHSAHHFSSFNNPAYLASVRETREVAMKRTNTVQASRWCAGCHDPVPFFSGAFDDPKFDDVNHGTAQAGITCTVCHAITNVNSTRGNGDFTIEEPIHYPFAKSENSILQWVNNTLVKAKPEFHKKTFLKPFHKTAEFCSTCHKVHLPKDVTDYKDFLRGQNHYDSYLLSGVSGHGARSFYYPPEAVSNCSGCHMPLLPAKQDFAAKLFPGATEPSVHNHVFPAANASIAWLKGGEEAQKAHEEFLKAKTRIDIFALREGGTVDGKLLAPIRPTLPLLKPSQEYLLETVVRTLKVGHPLTQGTVDSNELWVDLSVKHGDQVIGRNGALDEKGEVDRYAHFLNVFMLSRNGERINRRNPQDIFTPLYNHQVPPGAGQVVHYGFRLPPDAREPITIEAKLQYRKFDHEYMTFVISKRREGDNPIRGYEPGKDYINNLPIVTLCADKVTIGVEGGVEVTPPPPAPTPPPAPAPAAPAVAGTQAPAPTGAAAPAVGKDGKPAPPAEFPMWQRWNDYGIGLLLEGAPPGSRSLSRGELLQAEEIFTAVEKMGRWDGALNLARVYVEEGRLDEAVDALKRAAEHTDPKKPLWTMAWLNGRVNLQQGHILEAEKDFRSVVENTCVSDELRKKGFDFSLDIEVINLLGLTVFEKAKKETDPIAKKALLQEAADIYQRTLKIDSEDVDAHYNLKLLYGQLGNKEKSAEHQALHLKYKPDDNVGDAIRNGRQRYPWADEASNALVIYKLQRPGAPGLPSKAANAAAPVGAERSTKTDGDSEPTATSQASDESERTSPADGSPVKSAAAQSVAKRNEVSFNSSIDAVEVVHGE